MITIPTGDLVGILSDVFHFASPHRDLPDLNCLMLRWDGEMMHAFAHDRRHMAWSQWHPDDESQEEHQQELFTKWGGGEQLRTQRFHDSYVVHGTITEQTMQAGNAVSANAAQWLGDRVYRVLGGRS